MWWKIGWKVGHMRRYRQWIIWDRVCMWMCEVFMRQEWDAIWSYALCHMLPMLSDLQSIEIYVKVLSFRFNFLLIFFFFSIFQVKCNKNQNDRKIVIIIVSEPHTQKHNTRIENLSAKMMGWEKNVTNYKSSIIFRFLLPLTTIDAWSNQFIHNILSMRFLFFTFILFALN